MAARSLLDMNEEELDATLSPRPSPRQNRLDALAEAAARHRENEELGDRDGEAGLGRASGNGSREQAGAGSSVAGASRRLRPTGRPTVDGRGR